jgi:hypothetical protein
MRLEKVPHCVPIYAVTNEHVIEGVRNPAIRLNVPGGKTEIIVPKAKDWKVHPDGDDIAVASLKIEPFDLPPKYILPEGFLGDRLIETFHFGPGDETFMIGRFIGHEGRQRNTPTVRFGNISMMPTEPIRRPNGKSQKAFLVESRSMPGFSGSPVFVWVLPMSPRPPDGRQYAQSLGPWLLGIDCGHVNKSEEVRDASGKKIGTTQANTAMSIVAPAWRLPGLLESEELVAERRKEDEKLLKTQVGGIASREDRKKEKDDGA